MNRKYMLRNVICVILIVFAFLCFAHMKKADQYISTEKEEFLNENVCIYYPQFSGWSSCRKTERINTLIVEQLEMIIEQGEANKDEDSEFVLQLDYELGYVDEKFISIYYTGKCGYITAGQGPSYFAFSTNIDATNEKVITLDEFIIDLDALSSLLLNDEFEYSSTWDGETGKDLISRQYKGREQLLLERLNQKSFDLANHYMQWYIMEDRFVFVSFPGNAYSEYVISIEKISCIIEKKYSKFIM